MGNVIMEFPQEMWCYLDYDRIGGEYYASNSCTYTGTGLVVRKDGGSGIGCSPVSGNPDVVGM